MKLMKVLEGKPYKEQLNSLGLFSIGKGRLRADLIRIYSFLTRGGRGAGTDLSSLVANNRTQGNGRRCGRGGLGWILGKGSSPKGWWSTGTGSPGRLTLSKKHLDNALRDMV